MDRTYLYSSSFFIIDDMIKDIDQYYGFLVRIEFNSKGRMSFNGKQSRTGIIKAYTDKNLVFDINGENEEIMLNFDQIQKISKVQRL